MNKRIAEALVESGYASEYKQPVKHQPPEVLVRNTYWFPVLPFNDTLEGRRQLMALYFWTLFPDKRHIITGDGHFDVNEQIQNHVREYFEQLEKDEHALVGEDDEKP